MGLWLLSIFAVFVVAIAVLWWSYITLDRMGRRCLAVMTPNEFITPCEISLRHWQRYGALTDLWYDTILIRRIFQSLESRKRVLAIEKEPDEYCCCERAYCLKLGMRHTETSAKRPKLEWIPDVVPKPA